MYYIIMTWWIILIIIIAVLIIPTLVRSAWEVRHLILTRYKLETDKIPVGRTVRLAFVSDLHSRRLGKNNEMLPEMMKKTAPDAILIGGDMINRGSDEGDVQCFEVLKKTAAAAPCYYAPGNHEKYIEAFGEDSERWKGFMDALKASRIKFLDNEKADINEGIVIYGLSLGYEYFRKKDPETPDIKVIEDYIGKIDKNHYNIVLAHTPEYIKIYAETGADLVLSGHIHGGVVRLPGGRGLVSTRAKLFPKYCYGVHEEGETKLITTSGAGSHHINIRLFNRPEIVLLEITGK